jgi:hypothetical protein
MKLRRRRGATLGLVAVVVLVIAILGFGFFFLSKIMGGGREVANATDAGAMNVAKRALMEPTTPVGANSEFDGLGVDTTTGVPNGSNQFNLLAYNRAVGRAMLIALNAKAIGPASTSLADSVIGDLQALGQALQTELNGQGLLPGYFSDMASRENVKMMGPGSDVQLSGNITSAWLIPTTPANAKTNVYIDPGVVAPLGASVATDLTNSSVNVSGQPVSKGGWDQGNGITSVGGMSFLRAYDPNMRIGGLSKPVIGAAVGPQDRAHLVNGGQFDASTSAIGYAPPNSWKTPSRSQEMKSGNTGGAVACAIVGCLNAEYEACIPRGYVRLRNYDSATPVVGPTPSGADLNGGNSIFNNEFWSGTGGSGPTFYSNPVGGQPCFVEQGAGGSGAIAAWAAYNASAGTLPAGDPNLDSLNRDKRKDPLGQGVTPNTPGGASIPPIRWGCNNGQYATRDQCLQITGSSGSCDQNDFDQAGGDPNCTNYISCWSQNFGRGTSGGGGGGSPGMTGVEMMKSQVIDAFGRGQRCSGHIKAPGAAGMKTYARGAGHNTPRTPVKFMSVGTPWQLLDFIAQTPSGACATTQVVQSITQRCREIMPRQSNGQPVDQNYVINNLLKDPNAQMPPGTSLFIYRPLNSSQLVIKPTLPSSHDNTLTRTPEGTPVPCSSDTDWNLRNFDIDAEKGVGGNNKGDTGIHDQPYTKWYPQEGEFGSTDIVEWKPSCGKNNFLGECSFRNETTGGGEFCKPN